MASAKRPTTKSISPSCSKAIEDGKCARLVNHKGDCRLTLSLSSKTTKTNVAKPRRTRQPKAVKGNYKFLMINGTKFRVTVNNRGEATVSKVVRTLRAAPSERIVAAPSKTVKRSTHRNSRRPTLARPSVG